MSDEAQNADFERLLEYLRDSRGFDFSGYKRPTLMRRVDRRMTQAGAKDYGAYLDYLRMHPDEFAILFNTILINVTGYFRDAPAWEYLQGEILQVGSLHRGPHHALRDGRLLSIELTALAIARMCSGELPQQPPTTSAPASMNRRA